MKNIIYVGNLDLDQEENDLFAKHKIKNINWNKLSSDKNNILKYFKNFVSSFEYLHVTFDIDVLDKNQASATGIPSKNGLRLKDIEELLSIVGKHSNLSFDLTEVNPQKAGIECTVKSAHKVLLASLFS